MTARRPAKARWFTPAAAAISAAMCAPGLAAPQPPLDSGEADLIPQGVLDEAHPVAEVVGPGAHPLPSRLRRELFLEEALTLSAVDDVVVPSPQPPPRWQNRTSFDARVEWRPVSALTFTLSDRLNLFAEDGQAWASRNTVRNDLREAFVGWQPRPAFELDGGRINVRNGVALGFNPTDFFKTRALVGQASLDPSVLRQNRLGTFMVRGQAIWSGGSASVAFAPELTTPSPIIAEDPLGVDPHVAATNAAPRVLVTLGLDVLDLGPQLLGYYEPGRAKLGLDVSRPIGAAVIVYAEWAGGPEQDLIARAIAFGKGTGELPDVAPLVPPTATSTSFRNDVAAGLSWALGGKVTLNLEYHLHQGGFGRDDWCSWFGLGGAPGAPAALAQELWYVRAYAYDQQEPVTRHQAFVRASWPRAFVSDLELSSFAFVNLVDGSVLGQAAASYYLSPRWTASAFVSVDLGTARSERGSLPQPASSIIQVTLYL